MTNTRKSTLHSPQFRQAAITSCSHANNANNFSYEKTPLRYNLVRTPNLAAKPVIPARSRLKNTFLEEVPDPCHSVA